MDAAQVMDRAAYLALEAESEQRHEYLGGQVIAMAGASMRHNLISTNLSGLLRSAFEATDCRVVANDQRVHIEATGGYTYPDVVVSCGSPQLSGEKPSSLNNPTVLVEVLSASTWMHDLAYKLAHYRRIESVSHILFVSSEERQILQYRRGEEAWMLTDHVEGTMDLVGLGVSLSLDAIYAKTDGLPVE